MAERLVTDPERPGLNSQDRDNNNSSEFIVIEEDTDPTDECLQKEQISQLKLIKTHLEVLNNEVINEVELEE